MRKFTRDNAARAAHTSVAPRAAVASAAAVARNYNVGDCGCGGSGVCGGGGPCVCTPTPPGGGGGYGGGGVGVGGNGTLVGNQTPGGPSRPQTGTAVPIPAIGQRPANLDMNAWNAYAANGYAGAACVPYVDAIRDCLFMQTIKSTLTAVGIGATVNVDVSPVSGWFDAYYIDVTAYLTGGIDAGPNSFNMTIPTIVGCSTNPCDDGLPMNRAFFAAREACCCGRPFRAVIPKSTEGTPLRTAVTNLNAAAITAQVVVRGFCYSSRICV